jgi:hypothetical protein
MSVGRAPKDIDGTSKAVNVRSKHIPWCELNLCGHVIKCCLERPSPDPSSGDLGGRPRGGYSHREAPIRYSRGKRGLGSGALVTRAPGARWVHLFLLNLGLLARGSPPCSSGPPLARAVLLSLEGDLLARRGRFPDPSREGTMPSREFEGVEATARSKSNRTPSQHPLKSRLPSNPSSSDNLPPPASRTLSGGKAEILQEGGTLLAPGVSLSLQGPSSPGLRFPDPLFPPRS